MSLIDKLYAGEAIPPGTCIAKVKQMEKELTRRLIVKLSRQYNWYAICSVAVEAGIWGGVRRIRQRRKLLNMINTCRAFCGKPALAFKEGWEEVGLRYGYCVYQQSQGRGLEIALTRVVLGKLKRLIKERRNPCGSC